MKTPEARFAFVSGGLGLGGSTTFLLNLGSELSRLGHRVHVWTMEQESPLAKDFEERSLPISWIGRKGRIFEDRIRECLRELSIFQPTTLVANLGPEAFEVLRYARGWVTKVGIIHSDDPKVYRSLKPYFGLTDFVVGVSQEIYRRLGEDCGIPHERLRMIHCGIELPEEGARRGRDPERLQVLYLGRLDQQQKRVRLFEPITQLLRKLGTNFRLTIVGDGPERSWLAEMIQRNDLSGWIELRPAVPYREVADLFKNFDVLLLPSAFEGLPLSLLESMASGIVPVTTRLPSGSDDVVNASNGILVEAENTIGYAEAIDRLARDQDLLKELSEGARRTITEHYSSRTMAQQWLLLDCKCKTPKFSVSASRVLPPYGCESSFRFTTFGRFLRRTKTFAERKERNK
jgi:colanic acid/amylovoran biosynthesis glycosyltransferase